jgi:O-methyltransferase
MKRILKTALSSFGYEIQRSKTAATGADAIAVKTVKESQCYTGWSSSTPIYAGWLGDKRFDLIYNTVRGHTIVSVDRCYLLYCLAGYAVHLDGDFAECGVYKGGTAFLLSEMSRPAKLVHLFDAFEGLPQPDENDNYYKAGDFSDTNIDDVRRLLDIHEERIRIHEGWMPDTFANVGTNTFSLVHIDVDLYRTAMDCCEFFFSRLCKGGILVFDDYGFPACRGEKDAVDEFFSAKPEMPICLPTGQAIVIKL